MNKFCETVRGIPAVVNVFKCTFIIEISKTFVNRRTCPRFDWHINKDNKTPQKNKRKKNANSTRALASKIKPGLVRPQKQAKYPALIVLSQNFLPVHDPEHTWQASKAAKSAHLFTRTGQMKSHSFFLLGRQYHYSNFIACLFLLTNRNEIPIMKTVHLKTFTTVRVYSKPI